MGSESGSTMRATLGPVPLLPRRLNERVSAQRSRSCAQQRKGQVLFVLDCDRNGPLTDRKRTVKAPQTRQPLLCATFYKVYVVLRSIRKRSVRAP